MSLPSLKPRFLLALKPMISILFLLLAFHNATSFGDNIFITRPSNSGRYRHDFCVQQSSLLRPSVMRDFRNGSCLLMDIQPTSNVLVPSLYRRIKTAQNVLLLRTSSLSTIDPFNVLNQGVTNNTQIDVKHLRSHADYFLSPFIDMRPVPFSQITFRLLQDVQAAKPNIELVFKLKSFEWLRLGRWFTNKRLVHASPWNLTHMRRRKFLEFSANGRRKRRFFIHTSGKRCDNLAGYLFLYSGNGTGCTWESEWKDRNYYLYDPTGGGIPFRRSHNLSRELQIFGTSYVTPDADPIYVRMK